MTANERRTEELLERVESARQKVQVAHEALAALTAELRRALEEAEGVRE